MRSRVKEVIEMINGFNRRVRETKRRALRTLVTEEIIQREREGKNGIWNKCTKLDLGERVLFPKRGER